MDRQQDNKYISTPQEAEPFCASLLIANNNARMRTDGEDVGDARF